MLKLKIKRSSKRRLTENIFNRNGWETLSCITYTETCSTFHFIKNDYNIYWVQDKGLSMLFINSKRKEDLKLIYLHQLKALEKKFKI